VDVFQTIKTSVFYIRELTPEVSIRYPPNLTPADVYYGRGDLILKERARLKRVSLHKRRMEYQQFKMTEKSENQKNYLVLN